jgi:hypothetical protein
MAPLHARGLEYVVRQLICAVLSAVPVKRNPG